jgi:hypothetical protein
VPPPPDANALNKEPPPHSPWQMLPTSAAWNPLPASAQLLSQVGKHCDLLVGEGGSCWRGRLVTTASSAQAKLRQAGASQQLTVCGLCSTAPWTTGHSQACTPPASAHTCTRACVCGVCLSVWCARVTHKRERDSTADGGPRHQTARLPTLLRVLVSENSQGLAVLLGDLVARRADHVRLGHHGRVPVGKAKRVAYRWAPVAAAAAAAGEFGNSQRTSHSLATLPPGAVEHACAPAHMPVA